MSDGRRALTVVVPGVKTGRGLYGDAGPHRPAFCCGCGRKAWGRMPVFCGPCLRFAAIAGRMKMPGLLDAYPADQGPTPALDSDPAVNDNGVASLDAMRSAELDAAELEPDDTIAPTRQEIGVGRRRRSSYPLHLLAADHLPETWPHRFHVAHMYSTRLGRSKLSGWMKAAYRRELGRVQVQEAA